MSEHGSEPWSESSREPWISEPTHRRRFNWTAPEEECLKQIFMEKEITKKLRIKQYRKDGIYAIVASEMAKLGYDRTVPQIKQKWQNIKRGHQAVKAQNKATAATDVTLSETLDTKPSAALLGHGIDTSPLQTGTSTTRSTGTKRRYSEGCTISTAGVERPSADAKDQILVDSWGLVESDEDIAEATQFGRHELPEHENEQLPLLTVPTDQLSEVKIETLEPFSFRPASCREPPHHLPVLYHQTTLSQPAVTPPTVGQPHLIAPQPEHQTEKEAPPSEPEERLHPPLRLDRSKGRGSYAKALDGFHEKWAATCRDMWAKQQTFWQEQSDAQRRWEEKVLEQQRAHDRELVEMSNAALSSVVDKLLNAGQMTEIPSSVAHSSANHLTPSTSSSDADAFSRSESPPARKSPP